MEIEGKIILDLPEEGGTSKAGNAWRKKGWVLETFGQYPRKVKFDIFGDRIDSIRFEVGKSYKVSLDAESREFNGRWYTDLRAYATQEVGSTTPDQTFNNNQTTTQFGQSDTASSQVDPFSAGPNETDDLPF